MNEAGLVVETLMLPSTQNPAAGRPPRRDRLGRSTSSTTAGPVEEVIASDKAIRISQAMPMPIHFFVCDAQGHAAVVEFIEGKLVCHTGEQLPHKLITNDTCDNSLAYLAEHDGFGGTKPIRQGSRRFAGPFRHRRRPAQGLPAARLEAGADSVRLRHAGGGPPGRSDQVEHRLRSQESGDPLQDRAMRGNPDRPSERPRLQPADAGPHDQHQHAAHGRAEPALHGLRRRS